MWKRLGNWIPVAICPAYRTKTERTEAPSPSSCFQTVGNLRLRLIWPGLILRCHQVFNVLLMCVIIMQLYFSNNFKLELIYQGIHVAVGEGGSVCASPRTRVRMAYDCISSAFHDASSTQQRSIRHFLVRLSSIKSASDLVIYTEEHVDCW